MARTKTISRDELDLLDAVVEALQGADGRLETLREKLKDWGDEDRAAKLRLAHDQLERVQSSVEDVFR